MTTWLEPAEYLESDTNNPYQLSFYLAGTNGNNIFVETNNAKLRCKTLAKDLTLDTGFISDPTDATNMYYADSFIAESPPLPTNRYLTGLSNSSPF